MRRDAWMMDAMTGLYTQRLLTNGDLLIRDLAFSDMGMFKCIVRNDFGEDMKETFVYPHAVSSLLFTYCYGGEAHSLTYSTGLRMD